MLRRESLVLVAVLISVGIVVAGGPAQTVLQDLAETERNARMWNGYLWIGAGVLTGVGVAALLAQEGLGIYGLAIGALVALPGIIILAVPSKAEREYTTAGGSEARAAVALQRLANEGYTTRLLTGVIDLAVGVASLVSPYSFVSQYDYVYATVLYGGLAAYNFLVPSAEEQALQRYRELSVAGATP